MKKLLAMLLSCTLLLTGCTSLLTHSGNTEESKESTDQKTEEIQEKISEGVIAEEKELDSLTEDIERTNVKDEIPEFSGLNDEELKEYVKASIYENVIEGLDSDEFFVEKVEACYLSQEIIEESAYNSQSNIFFGYTLNEIEKEFQGTRYIFTLGEEGQTIVTEYEEVSDDTYNQVIKNVAIGSGVILICVTISVATAGTASTAAVSAIFAASATTGTVFAVESGTLGFVTASLARGYQTHDFDEAIKAGMLEGSEGFKWGAIFGATSGGFQKTLELNSMTAKGLSLKEVARIQKESKWPPEIIACIHSKEEYEIYKDLVPTKLSDDTWVLMRKIDWNLVDSEGRTNMQRIAVNLVPVDKNGIPYELHHIGQKTDTPLAILTWEEHHSKENHYILNYAKQAKDISKKDWEKQRHKVWKMILETVPQS